MKRRKNAIYTGKSKRVSTGTGDRLLVDRFYLLLNEVLLPEDDIEIIPPEQVNPTHDRQEQLFIVADYCVRKILPEVTSLFRWGDEFTPLLRALAPVVDRKTADAAYAAADDASDAAYAAYDPATRDAFGYAADFEAACNACVDAAFAAFAAADLDAANAADATARCVYYALIACIEAGDEAAYNRIIALTNEMLESL